MTGRRAGKWYLLDKGQTLQSASDSSYGWLHRPAQHWTCQQSVKNRAHNAFPREVLATNGYREKGIFAFICVASYVWAYHDPMASSTPMIMQTDLIKLSRTQNKEYNVGRELVGKGSGLTELRRQCEGRMRGIKEFYIWMNFSKTTFYLKRSFLWFLYIRQFLWGPV